MPLALVNDDVVLSHSVGALSVMDTILLYARHKKFIIYCLLIAGLVSTVIALLIPNKYTATARILPPQQNQSSAAMMLGQIAGIAGLSPGSFGVKNPNDLYVGMLRSRTISDALIDQFNLRDLYDEETYVDTRDALADNTKIVSGKDGIISIHVDDRDPNRAAQLANAYVSELHKLNQKLALTEASQRRLFFEEQLVKVRKELSEAENEMKLVQEKSGVIVPDEQGKALIEAAATIRGQITAKEVELASIRAFATDENPALILVKEQLTSLRAQLARMESPASREKGDVIPAASKIPEAGLVYARRLRDVKYYETVLELLAKQFELAKIDEARDASLIQILDLSIPPDKKSGPRRVVIVICSMLMILLLSLLRVRYMEGR